MEHGVSGKRLRAQGIRIRRQNLGLRSQEKRERDQRSEVGGQRSKFRISKLMTDYRLLTPGYLSLYDLNDLNGLDNGHFMLYCPHDR